MPANERTLLIVGANGFAGRHLAEAAQDRGTRVVRATRDRRGDLTVDLLDVGSLERAIATARPTHVANLAGRASVGASWREPAGAFEVNVIGAVNVLEAVRRQQPRAHVLCVSSGEVYGGPEGSALPAREDDPLRPLNPYGASKAALEIACSLYAETRDLRIAVIRAFNQIGPGQSDSFVAADFARQIASAEQAGGQPVRLATADTAAARDFTDVRDMARAYMLVIERELVGTFNACSEKAMRISELIDQMAGAAGIPVEFEVDPVKLRPAEAPVLYGSAERLREATGWKPEIPLEQTLNDLLDWWRAELAHS